MRSTILLLKLVSCLSLLCLSASCTGLHHAENNSETTLQHVSVAKNSSLLSQYAPIFILEDVDNKYNLIGTPAVRGQGDGKADVYVNPDRATIYSMEKSFTSHTGEYKNLIYRIHFEKVPFKHLTAGKNVGLIVIVTLNQQNKPLLLTTVHTCGCYLAIVPTSNLPQQLYPDNWSQDQQQVYGETLPGLLKIDTHGLEQQKIVLRIRSGTHRVMHLDLISKSAIIPSSNDVTAELKSFEDLRNLPFGNSKISFFETEGARKGYVRNSYKPLERLLMSWWAMDWRVGEDKDLGPREETGTTFYTSLKFWAWKKSDLWNFANFLDYWGWKL